MRGKIGLGSAIVALALSLGAGRAQDQPPEDTTHGVARISLMNGEVNVRRGDSGDWVAATANAPLLVEDHVATGGDSRAEVQFNYANFLRLAANTEVQLAELQANRYQIQILHGTVDFSVLQPTNADVEVDTPSVSVRPKQRGNYRITVLDNGESEITVRSGQTEIYTPRGVETVSAGQTMMVRGDPTNPEYQVVAAIAPDDWDRWNTDRDNRLGAAGNNVYNRYVSPDIYGAESTEGYGRWTYANDYGWVWAPTQAAGWAPYQNGRWVWEDYYGWTWVSYDPWGWAPYHYGRWLFNAGYGGWCWWPGPIHSHYWWAPAYVGFFGFGGGGFGVGFGFGNVGWVPLAPFEVCHPWWGRGFGGGYYGRGFGGGYYGRNTIVNNVNIYNTYRNARVNNGITAVGAHDFASGRFGNRVPVTQNALHTAGMVQGRLGITPTAQNLRYSNRQVASIPRQSPNQRFFQNHVVSGQRTPFAQQQRAMGGNPTLGGSRTAAGAGGSYRPGNNAPTITGSRGDGAGSSRGTAAGGYRRFGDPAAGAAAPQRNAPQGATPSGSFNRGGANNSTGGWHRFGEAGTTAAPGGVNRGSGPNGGQRFGTPSGSAPAPGGANRGSAPNGGQRFGTPSGSTAAPGSVNRGNAPASGGWHRFGEAGSTAAPGGVNRGSAPNGGQRFGTPSGSTPAPGSVNRGNAPAGGGWHRFGEPGGTSSPGSAYRGGNAPSSGGWQRFGSPGSGAAPRSNYGAPQGGRIPMNPPSVRERGTTPRYDPPQYSRPGGSYNAPQYNRPSGGGYSAPQYSRPSPQYSRPSGGGYSAPQYRAPSPSYGGGRSYSGGGRSYSGGGGYSGGGRSYSGGGGGRSYSGGGGGHSSSSSHGRR